VIVLISIDLEQVGIGVEVLLQGTEIGVGGVDRLKEVSRDVV
jgi:hypothetical protein